MSPVRTHGAYPADWQQVALEVKAKAGWRCIRCGHLDDPARCVDLDLPRGHLDCDHFCSHREPGPLDGGPQRVLTVHHFDGDKANCRWWNLLALCQVCHLAFQGKVDPYQTYMDCHREWLMPYVAGFYAFTLLRQDVKRHEAEDRMLELLTVGQPHLYDAYRAILE